MSQTWAEIDARPHGAITPWQVVGGVPLVVRQLRQGARLGWIGARILVADDADRTRIHEALRRWPVPAGLAIELAVEPERGASAARPGAIVLDGTAIYAPGALATAPGGGASPIPLLALRDRSHLRRARAALMAGIRKSVALDGLVAYYVIRPITRPIVRLLVDTRVTPNQVTAAALVCGLTAAVLASRGGAMATALAGLLYWIGGALDCMDGDLARLRLTSSKLGEWLDSMTDETSTYALCAGLGIGLWRDDLGPGWLAVGVGAAAAGVLAMAPLYRDLHRRGMPIDTAQFPWFFQDGAGDTAERRGFARLIYLAGFLVRRDVNTTAVAVLLVVGQRPIALAAMAAGAAVGLGLTVTHFAVTGRRRRLAAGPPGTARAG